MINKIRNLYTNRRNREQLYSTANYWDSKAIECTGSSVSMWANKYLNEYYEKEALLIIDHYFSDVTGLNILDLGCGTGRLSRYLASKGANVIGVDFSSESISLAQQIKSPFNVEYDVGSVFDLDYSETFDAVLTSVVLTVACKNKQELLQAFKNINLALKVGGKLLLIEPVHKGFLHRVLDMKLTEFSSLLEISGFNLVHTKGLNFWPTRLFICYVQLPKFITASGYWLGNLFMRISGHKLGDYTVLYARKQR